MKMLFLTILVFKILPAIFLIGLSLLPADLSRGFFVHFFESADEVAGITDVHEGQGFFNLGIFHERNHYPERK